MKTWRDDSGLTLTELLVVCSLLGVILAAMFALSSAAQAITNISSARTTAATEAQLAVEQFTRDIRQAQQNPDPTPGATQDKGAFTIATGTKVQFYADVDHNRKPDLVTWEVVGSELRRSVTPPTNANYQFTYGTVAAPRRIVKKLATTTGVFCYHTNTVDSAATCPNGEKHGFTIVSYTTDPLNTPTKICLVGINVANSAASGDQTVTVTTSAIAKIRSVANEVQ